jgi:hypothetical protein
MHVRLISKLILRSRRGWRSNIDRDPVARYSRTAARYPRMAVRSGEVFEYNGEVDQGSPCVPAEMRLSAA